ncbi:MAG: helicase-exonuclease AddAB subunit AddA [Clostridia bacterium]
MADKKWTNEQNNAINVYGKNILVSASAGSGKTAVLVERVIHKVINEKIDIDKILVVTFTNAAAAELKERLLLAIYKKLDENPKDFFLRRQVLLLNRANITTIHAFCLELIRSNFNILDIDPAFSICDQSQSDILKNKAISKILDSQYTIVKDEKNKNNLEITSDLYNVLELFSGKDDDFIAYIFNIYSYIQSFAYPYLWLSENIEKYNIKLNTDLTNTNFGKQIFENAIDELKIVSKKTEELLNTIEKTEEFSKQINVILQDVNYINNCIDKNENSWDRLYSLLNEISFSRMAPYKGQNIEIKEKINSFRTKIIKNTIENLKKSIYSMSEKILEDNRVAYQYVNYIYNIVIRFNEEYMKLKKDANLLDFNDIEHMAFELLVIKSNTGKMLPTAIAENLKNKFSEIYTDEYQDTSFIQEAILEAISGGKNRFMVGDIKQSIYRFRQAMPEIFNSKYATYQSINNIDLKKDDKNIKISLSKNFRSRAEVLDSINYIFEKIMSMEVGDCDYSNYEMLKVGLKDIPKLNTNNYLTEINIVNLKEDETFLLKDQNEDEEECDEDETLNYLKELKAFETEAYLIAKKIKELKENFKIYNSKTNEFVSLKYKDIAILLRSIKTRSDIIEKALKSEEIPVFCDAYSNIFEGEEIKLVLCFLRILDNPLQDIYLVSVMYSIVGGFSLDDLVYIRSNDTKKYLYENIIDTKENLLAKEKRNNIEEKLLTKINNFLDILAVFFKYSKIYSVSELLIRLYKQTNIYTQFLTDNMSAQRKANLNLLIDLAKKFEKNISCTLNSYINYIDSLKDKTDSSTSSVKILGENEDVVRVMTIHKSKGLEFPIVIVADTAKKYNLKDTSASVNMHHELGIGINVVNKDLNVTYPSVIKQAIKQKITEETKSEELRMLYVALTRAKEKLIIFASVQDYYKKKENLTVLLNSKNKIEPRIVLQNSSYFDNILLALKIYLEDINDKSIFDINVINVKSEEFLKSIDLKEIKNKTNISIKQRKENLLQNCNLNLKSNKLFQCLENNLNLEYKFKEDSYTPQRVSVSELKKANDEDELKNIFDTKEQINLNTNIRVPSVLNDEKISYTSVRKGTLIHFILEHLDFLKTYDKLSLKEYINDLVAKNVITKQDASYINIDKIFNFLNSSIGKELKESKKIYKEEAFVLKDDKFSNSIIQGVIDLYYITKDGKVILVDFKTDKTNKTSYYIKKYKKQLDIYKEAIEKLTDFKVSNSYIYSFEMNDKIEL